MSGARFFFYRSRRDAVGGQRGGELARNLDDTNGSISPSQYCPDPNGIKRKGRKWMIRLQGRERGRQETDSDQRTIYKDWFIEIFVANLSKSGATRSWLHRHRHRTKRTAATMASNSIAPSITDGRIRTAARVFDAGFGTSQMEKPKGKTTVQMSPFICLY